MAFFDFLQFIQEVFRVERELSIADVFFFWFLFECGFLSNLTCARSFTKRREKMAANLNSKYPTSLMWTAHKSLPRLNLVPKQARMKAKIYVDLAILYTKRHRVWFNDTGDLNITCFLNHICSNCHLFLLYSQTRIIVESCNINKDILTFLSNTLKYTLKLGSSWICSEWCVFFPLSRYLKTWNDIWAVLHETSWETRK